MHVDGHDLADLSRIKRPMKKMGDLFSKGKARREISCAIEDITKQLQEMTERHARYRVDDLVAKVLIHAFRLSTQKCHSLMGLKSQGIRS